MSALAVGAIVFACVFGGALFGMYLGTVLPEGGAGTWFADCLGQ
jgi:hypothetical protein